MNTILNRFNFSEQDHTVFLPESLIEINTMKDPELNDLMNKDYRANKELLIKTVKAIFGANTMVNFTPDEKAQVYYSEREKSEEEVKIEDTKKEELKKKAEAIRLARQGNIQPVSQEPSLASSLPANIKFG